MRALNLILRLFLRAIAGNIAALQGGRRGIAAWREEFVRQIMRYHLAAFMAGAKKTDLTDAEAKALQNRVKAQVGFLDNFAVEIQDGAEWRAGWEARAASYAGAVKASYWQGDTKMLPLPAMPGDGTTQCINNCKCKWDIRPVNAKQGDYDCYWRMGDAEHCQSCKQRAMDWNPLKIRGGRVVSR